MLSRRNIFSKFWTLRLIVQRIDIPTSKLFHERSYERDNKIMATYSLLVGIIVIIISWKIYKDWASGIAGFIYGGFLFWSINLILQLIKALAT